MMRNVYQDPSENPFAFPQGRKLYTFSARYSEVWLFPHFHNFVSEGWYRNVYDCTSHWYVGNDCRDT